MLLKVIFSQTTLVGYLSAKFQVSSIVLASFRPGVIPPSSENKPVKNPPGLGLNKVREQKEKYKI